MMAPVLDKPARAMKCPQCGAYVLLGQVNGFKVAVDVQPLTLDEYRAELIAGRDVYAFVRGKLRHTGRGSWNHPLETRKRQHPCRAFASVPLDVPQEARSAPPCDVRRAAGWNPPPDCLRATQAGAERFRSCKHCEKPPFSAATLAPGTQQQSIEPADSYGGGVEQKQVGDTFQVWGSDKDVSGEVSSQIHARGNGVPLGSVQDAGGSPDGSGLTPTVLELFVSELGATVVSIEVAGKEIYRNESLA